MARVRSPNRDKAFEIYKENSGNITNREIANILKEDEKVIAVWKSRDKWNEKCNVVQQPNKSCTTKRKGGQPGNKNAVGNKGGAAPAGNKNAEKHGFFTKWLPDETKEIIQELASEDPLDILWNNILLQQAAILRAQNIMHVTGKDEIIKEVVRSKTKSKVRETEKTTTTDEEKEIEYAFQFAWDRHATFLTAQSRAYNTYLSMIRQYFEMINKDWDTATEEQKQRVEYLKAQIAKTKGEDNKEQLEKLDEVLNSIKGVV